MTREAKRVARILRRDKREREDEAERIEAARELAAGKSAAGDRARLGPTPEHAAKVEFEHVTLEVAAGSVREVRVLRRASVNRVKQLYDRGVLSDDTYPGCLWYQRQWEGAGFVLGSSAAKWGDAVAGQPAYGAMATTVAAAECREMFRFARLGLAPDPSLLADVRMLDLFDMVVLGEATIEDAARVHVCRPTTATLRLRAVAWRLRERISHLLPVREVGALAAEMGVEAVVRVERPTMPETGGIASGGAEIEDLGQLAGGIDPRFRNARGFIRPMFVIAKILRGEALLDEEEEL